LVRDAGMRSNPWHAVRYQVLERFAARHGWTAEMLGVSALLFLVHLTAYRMRPGVTATLSEHWVAELLRVDNILTGGRSPGQLFQELG
jgi:hypothetical protein